MPLERKHAGTAKIKRNCWPRGKGPDSYRGELKRGISLNKKYLNRKVRHSADMSLKGGSYRKLCKTIDMVNFTERAVFFAYGEHGLFH